MKKILFLLLTILFLQNSSVFAHCYNQTYGHMYYGHHGYHNYYYRTSSHYVVHKDFFEDEIKLKDCTKHSLIAQTTIYYYSDGTRRSYTKYSILNSDGTTIAQNCSEVKHVLYNKKHYFLIKQNGSFKILDDNGDQVSKRKYTKMKEISSNKILVQADKKYGIIDLADNVIVPIKYSSIEQINGDLFITKLNGYYGVINSSNKIYLKNEYDKIKSLYDTYVFKKKGKFGLLDIYGNLILKCENDSIKKLGEYIIVEKDNIYQAYNSQGELINQEKYNKIKLDRNSLYGKIKGQWQVLDSENVSL